MQRDMKHCEDLFAEKGYITQRIVLATQRTGSALDEQALETQRIGIVDRRKDIQLDKKTSLLDSTRRKTLQLDKIKVIMARREDITIQREDIMTRREDTMTRPNV